MNINVIDKNVESLVCVVVNDWCNHYDSMWEEVATDFFTLDGHEQYTRELEVCQRCGAWRDEYDSQWEEV